jgi:L-threonylcarbamoyladenylate synthase
MKDPDIEKIAAILKKGGIALLPAGTVYGLFCSALSKKGATKIYSLKGRSYDKPLQVFLNDRADIKQYASVSPEKAKKIASYLPGPYTIILKLKKSRLRTFSFLKTGTAGFRVVNIAMINDIIFALGSPLASTSANISGDATPVKYADITDKILKGSDIKVKNDILAAGRASSVIDMTGRADKVLRK